MLKNLLKKSGSQLFVVVSLFALLPSVSFAQGVGLQQNAGGLQQGVSLQSSQSTQSGGDIDRGTVDPVQLSQQGSKAGNLSVVGAPSSPVENQESDSKSPVIYIVIAVVALAVAYFLFMKSRKVPEDDGESDDYHEHSFDQEPLAEEAVKSTEQITIEVASVVEPKEPAQKPVRVPKQNPQRPRKKKHKKKKSRR